MGRADPRKPRKHVRPWTAVADVPKPSALFYRAARSIVRFTVKGGNMVPALVAGRRSRGYLGRWLHGLDAVS
jgi:hypothetical protein